MISKKLKQLWLERLVSPEAKWAKGALKDTETGGMCCLGHLADIQGHLTPKGRFHPRRIERHETGSRQICVISTNVEGLWEPTTEEFYGLDLYTQKYLARLNDSQKAFPIDAIRALPTGD